MNGLTITAGRQSLSPIALFLHADIVVKVVMLGLLVASLATWTIIVGRGAILRKAAKADKAFEADFTKAADVDRFYNDHLKSDVPAARVFSAGIAE